MLVPDPVRTVLVPPLLPIEIVPPSVKKFTPLSYADIFAEFIASEPAE